MGDHDPIYERRVKENERKRKLRLWLAYVCSRVVMIGLRYQSIYLNKRPRYGPRVTSTTYVEGLLQGDPNRCREVCRMEIAVFKQLCDLVKAHGLLRDTPRVSVDEQIAMFLFTLGNKAHNRQVQERFQRSGETVSRYFNQVCDAIRKLAPLFISPPSNETPPEIAKDGRFFPYFKDCIGVIDGIHIPVFVEGESQVPWRNHENYLSQNVLAVCSFDFNFLFVMPGWEGSASDATVLSDALTKGFSVPEGKYYLVDIDYANTTSFLAPYRGVRYCSKESSQENPTPKDHGELFNIRHFLLWNTIKQVFGILKKRFPILTEATSYPLQTQVKLVNAACALHNFIRVASGGDDFVYDEYRNELVDQEKQGLQTLGEVTGQPRKIRRNTYVEEEEDGKMMREEIARKMYDDYIYSKGI